MRTAAAFVLLCGLAGVAAPALAQSRPTGRALPAGKRPAALAQSLTGAAKEAFASAQVLLNNGDNDGAYAKFGQAYDASKDSRLLFNMAVCARNMHDYARMQGLLLRYERESGAALAPDDKADVESALATIRSLIGTVKLSASEPGAAVSVDGARIGTTPLAEGIVLNLGKHALSVSKEGFQTVEQSVEVPGGGDLPVAVTLAPARHAAHLIVASDAGATVVIDGQSAAKGRFDGQVHPGAHTVEITESGKTPYKAQVELRDAETRSLDVTLEDESHGAPIWPWIVGGAAVAIGAAVGGYFLFQPQDQTLPVPDGKSGTLRLAAFKR